MRLALVLVVVLGCSSQPKQGGNTTTPPGGSAATEPTGSGSAGGGAGSATAQAKAQYSCFSYTSKNSTVRRHACSRNDDCGSYLEQAKSVPGLREFTDCASVATVFCFHQAATKDDPEGQDICQPTLDECKTGRADVVRAKLVVDSECAQK